MKTHRESKTRPRTVKPQGVLHPHAIGGASNRREAAVTLSLALAASFAGFGVWRLLHREWLADAAWAAISFAAAAVWLIAWRTASAQEKPPRRTPPPQSSNRPHAAVILTALGLIAALAGVSNQEPAGIAAALLLLVASIKLRLVPNQATLWGIAGGGVAAGLVCFRLETLAGQAPAIATASVVAWTIWDQRPPSRLELTASASRRGSAMDRVSTLGMIALERRLFSEALERPRIQPRSRFIPASALLGGREISWPRIREELVHLHSSLPDSALKTPMDLTPVSAQERNPVASSADLPMSRSDESRVIRPDDVLNDQVPASDVDTKLELAANDKDFLARNAAPSSSASRRPTPEPAKILVAEDSADIRRILSLFLRQAGYQHELAVNGRFAVERANAEPFDLILMDMQMPELDGYGATRTLREHGFEIPIIAVTAHTLSGSREECLAAGCTDYLPKPINRRDLVNLIERHLNLAKTKTAPSSPPTPPSTPSPSPIS